MSDERENPDQSTDDNGSFQYDALEQSLDMPTFEFSSPISSIGSNCSSPDRERTIQQQPLQEQEADNQNDSSLYVSLEELKSQISPPSDGNCSGLNSTTKPLDHLETIFEDCYLETPPGTPTTPRPKKRARRARVNLNSFDEFKENLIVNCNQQLPDDKGHS